MQDDYYTVHYIKTHVNKVNITNPIPYDIKFGK